MIFIDEQTRQRVQRMKHTGDINYDLVGDKAVSEETIKVIGSWEDYTGSAIVSTKGLMYSAGIVNELEGSEPAVTEGARIPNLNIIGQPSDSTRRRVIKRNKDFK